MACYRSISFLCVVLFGCGYCSAADELLSFSKLLSQADVLSKKFEGRFEFYGAEERKDTPLDFQLDGLTLQAKGRLWVKSGNVLVEFLGGDEATAVGKGSRFNDIAEVLAMSDGTYFDFVPVGSTLRPYANLRVYTEDVSQEVRTRLEVHIFEYLNSVVSINGLNVASMLTDSNCVIRTDMAKGKYSVRAENSDAKNPSSISYELTVTGQDVKCESKISVGAPATNLTVHTLVEAELVDEAIIPRRVAKRTTGPGPARAVARREVMQFMPEKLEPVTFPITPDFFRRYERDYPVLQGNAEQSSQVISAVPEKFSAPLSERLNPNSNIPTEKGKTGKLIFIVGNIVVVLIILGLWTLSRRRQKNA